MKKIITHLGQGHRDEFIALCIILAKYMAEALVDIVICRRDPTEEELNDPEVWVVDVGLRHEPELRNFDHHQMPPEEGECAFTLVAKHFGLHEDMADIFGWYNLSSIMDARGPGGVAEELGTDFGTVIRLWSSPIEAYKLDLLTNTSEIAGSDPEGEKVLIWMRNFGKSLTNQVAVVKGSLAYLEKNVATVTVCGVPGMMLEREEQLRFTPDSINIYKRRQCPEAAFSVTPDDRGEGYALYRYEDDPRLDFHRLEFDDRILFAHKGGFIAKTKEALNQEELMSLVADAVIPAEKLEPAQG